ncbi:MAG: hypothetical protein ABEJ27_07950 [Halodesulfurarchaeum sp.]
MERKRALSWAGRYYLIASALAIVGLLFVGGGAYLAYTQSLLWTRFGIPMPPLSGRTVGGVLLLVIGLVIWRGGKAWALYLTLTGAIEEDLADTFDTEHVKSDIVAVLDDRLSDMQQDLQSVNRELRDLKGGSEFEFQED